MLLLMRHSHLLLMVATYSSDRPRAAPLHLYHPSSHFLVLVVTSDPITTFVIVPVTPLVLLDTLILVPVDTFVPGTTMITVATLVLVTILVLILVVAASLSTT